MYMIMFLLFSLIFGLLLGGYWGGSAGAAGLILGGLWVICIQLNEIISLLTKEKSKVKDNGDDRPMS